MNCILEYNPTVSQNNVTMSKSGMWLWSRGIEWGFKEEEYVQEWKSVMNLVVNEMKRGDIYPMKNESTWTKTKDTLSIKRFRERCNTEIE